MGRYAKGEERRAEILRAALDLIGRNGYRGSTLADIADAVGLTKAGVLHYFDSKDHLWAEVLRLRDEVDRPEDGTDLDTFLHVMAANADVPGLVHLFTALAADAIDAEHGAHDFFVDRYERVRGDLEDAVRKAQTAGDLPTHLDPAQVGRLLVATADGLQVQWLLDPSFDLAADIAAFVSMLSATDGPGR